MYALLQRFHRLQLQLESEMKETGIQYPCVINHIKKIEFSSSTKLSNLIDIPDEEIFDTVEIAKGEVQCALEDLGMSVKDKDGKWEDLTLKVVDNKDTNEDDKDDDNLKDDDGDSIDKEEGENDQGLEFVSKEELQEDVLNLQKAELVESELFQRLQNKKMKKLSSSSTISMYSAEDMEKCFEVRT